MIRFQTWLWIIYSVISLCFYPYLKNAYFPHKPSKFEKFVMLILSSFWLVSVPMTFIIKQDDEGEEL